MAPWSYLRPINTVLRWVFLVALCSVLLPFTYANATTISVTSDRNPVSVNESFQLTFTATETPDGDPDFSILNPYLEILNQNKNNSTSIINGQFQHQESWHLNVLIKQTGT
ncbi:MAG: protein BatD, partial [Methylococcales bacterium]|nr:protein BatD [Methylococcales bacterium]